MKPIYWLGLLPFIGMLGGSVFANRETPYVLGMPFILFWIVMWIVLTSLIMLLIYKTDQSEIDEGGDV